MMYLWIGAALVSYFVKGLCGFADALIFNSILSFGMNTADISPVLPVTGYPTNLIVAWQNRRGLKPRVWLPPAALVLAGCIPGAFMLKTVDARLIKFIFGFVVVALGVEMLLPRAQAGKASRLQARTRAHRRAGRRAVRSFRRGRADGRVRRPGDRNKQRIQGQHERRLLR